MARSESAVAAPPVPAIPSTSLATIVMRRGRSVIVSQTCTWMSVEARVSEVSNLVGGSLVAADSGRFFDKVRPADGVSGWRVARSDAADVDAAVTAASAAQPAWAAVNA